MYVNVRAPVLDQELLAVFTCSVRSIRDGINFWHAGSRSEVYTTRDSGEDLYSSLPVPVSAE